LHDPTVPLQLGEPLADLVRKQAAQLGYATGTERAIEQPGDDLSLVPFSKASCLFSRGVTRRWIGASK
jgi:hypothetical protein